MSNLAASRIIPVTITPFDKNGDIYEEGIENLYLRLSEYGVKKIFVCGSFASFALMTLDTKTKLAKSSTRIAKKYGLESIFNIASSSPDETLALLDNIKDTGIEYLSTMVPYYYSNNGTYKKQQIQEYLKLISNEAFAPLYFYNNPKTTNYDASPVEMIELAEKCELAGFKDSNDKINKLFEVNKLLKSKSSLNIDYIPGNTASMLMAGALNFDYCMSGLFMSFPDLITDLFTSVLDKNDLSVSANLYGKTLEIRKIIEKYTPRAISHYYLLKEMGVDVGIPKFPFPKLTKDNETAMIADLKQAGFIK